MDVGQGLRPADHIFTEEYAYAPELNEDGEAYDPVPFGIKHMDQTMIAGVMPYTSLMYVAQGAEGGRKTTLYLNIIINQNLSMQLPPDHMFYWFSAETSMAVEKLYLYLEGIIASKLLFYRRFIDDLSEEIKHVYKNIANCKGDKSRYIAYSPQIRRWLGGVFSRELDHYNVISTLRKGEVIAETDVRPERLIHSIMWPNKEQHRLTDWQRVALEIAKCAIVSFPMEAFGVSDYKGSYDVRELRRFPSYDADALWAKLDELRSDHGGNCQVFIDHVTAIEPPNGHTQWTSAPVIGPEIKRRILEFSNPFWLITQEATNQQKLFAQTGKTYGAMGGNYYAQEADCNIRVGYDGKKTPWLCSIYSPMKNRRGSWGDVVQPMIASTGAFVGQSIDMSEIQSY